jgi:dUTP pyrophosphatase
MERLIKMKVKRVRSEATLPEYATEGSSGLDVRACLEAAVRIPPLGRAKIPTGLAFELEQGCELQVRPRSGLALKYGITVLNSPGTIDSDYRGELCVILVNLGSEEYTVRHNERIAQLVAARVWWVSLEEVNRIDETDRGVGGFGSTGGFGDAAV